MTRRRLFCAVQLATYFILENEATDKAAKHVLDFLFTKICIVHYKLHVKNYIDRLWQNEWGECKGNKLWNIFRLNENTLQMVDKDIIMLERTIPGNQCYRHIGLIVRDRTLLQTIDIAFFMVTCESICWMLEPFEQQLILI